MKTYKELKEQVINEQDFATPRQEFMSKTINPVMGKARSGLAKVGDFAKANKGMLGAVGAGVVGLGLLTGLIRGRQGNRDNAPQKASTPPPSLSVTQAKEPDIAVGVPATRVSKAVRRIDPSVKPIDNRTTQA